jgi:RNA polymerase sigma factor (sigma-70 family)
MSDGTSAHLQAFLDRVRDGDPRAARDLLERAHRRLQRLVAARLRQDFPALDARHSVDSVLHDAWLRLLQAVEKSRPPTVADFFRLAAHKVHQVLLDLSERHRRREAHEPARLDSSDTLPQPLSRDGDDPARLALWTELHRQAALLPEPERTVFQMRYYLDLPVSEVARLLELSPYLVRKHWVAATSRLDELLELDRLS